MSAKSKLFWGPFWVFAACQLPVQMTFMLARILELHDHDWMVGHVICTGIFFLLGTIANAICIWDTPGWYHKYEDEQRDLEFKRERLRQKIDAEIGIPRVTEGVQKEHGY